MFFEGWRTQQECICQCFFFRVFFEICFKKPTINDSLHYAASLTGQRYHIKATIYSCNYMQPKTLKVVGEGYIIGFVTKRETDAEGISNVTIFVPTSPNPTTGLVFFFPEDKIEYLDMSPERAFSKIISLGMK